MITVIPAIDIIDGACVRLQQGVYSSKKVYEKDPLEMAKRFEGVGIKYLHMVDLDGARAKRVVNLHVLEKVATETGLIIDFGGGVRSDADINAVFNAGAKAVTAGSVAVKNRALALGWLKRFGADKIILGADVKNEKIAVSGWEETSEIELLPFLEAMQAAGFKRTICTDVSKDGLLAGPAIELYSNIKKELPKIEIVASGGVANMQDIKKLQAAGIETVIVGKAIYEGRIGLKELEQFIC